CLAVGIVGQCRQIVAGVGLRISVDGVVVEYTDNLGHCLSFLSAGPNCWRLRAVGRGASVRFGRYCVRYRLCVIFDRIQRVWVKTAVMRRHKGERGEVRRIYARRPSAAGKAPVTLRSSRLTTCRVAEDGADVRLEFINQSGKTVTVELPFDQAEAVVMT